LKENGLKILIIGSHSGIFPSTLTSKLRNAGLEVEHLDFDTFKLETGNGVKMRYAEILHKNILPKKLKTLKRLALLKEIIRRTDAQVIHFHYVRWFYAYLSPTIRQSDKKFIATVYGSDYYRIGTLKRRLQASFFKVVDRVTFTNEQTMSDVASQVSDMIRKSDITRFGLAPFETIDAYRHLTRREMLEILGIKNKPYIVVCGYNANPGQQHLKLIDALDRLSKEVRDQILFLFPMGYGGDKNYIRTVRTRLNDSRLDGVVLERFAQGKQLAALRLLPDMMINMLITDQLSGSMQEYLYAGKCVLAGSWLPYKTLERKGVTFIKVSSFEQLPDKVAETLAHMKRCQYVAQANKQAIGKLSSWEEVLPMWLDVYRKVEDN
jgi:glycosyltransferase involved in cell wall biosynthesis